MQLPGGLWRDGALYGDYRLKPVTGELELLLCQAQQQAPSLPAEVSEILVAFLQDLGGHRPDRVLTGALCVADRQFLMRRLAIVLGMDQLWQKARCPDCTEAFDVPITLSALPLKPASSDYPFVRVETSLGSLQFRLPNGEDQEAVHAIQDTQEAMAVLAIRCLLPEQDGPSESLPFNGDDLDKIDKALEACSPELVLALQTNCPHCNSPHQVDIDPYACINPSKNNLFAEIHMLAMYYHWSESDILALPSARRKLYLKLVDRSRGMQT